ncbi:MAG: hypothetical protein JXR59_07720 [Desulfuromonadaceae bacterium]|nr:hypothetical protein [Desulfuromonadaceae bacterium]
MPSLTTEQWEALCKRCGLCCFEKIRLPNGRVLTTPIPCRFLDLHSRSCRVYSKRFEVGENCQKLTPELVASVDWLPEECAYVQHLKQQQALPSDSHASHTPRKRKKRR